MKGRNNQGFEPRKHCKRKPQVRRCKHCNKIIQSGTTVLGVGRLCFACERSLGEFAQFCEVHPRSNYNR